MKKTILSIAFVAIGLTAIIGCGGESAEKKVEEHSHAEVYQCPMKCEGDKTYDKAGSCPVCGMDIKKVEHTH